MSLGGESIRDSMTPRERDLLDEVWVWRAVQQLLYRGGPVTAWMDGRDYEVVIHWDGNGKTYVLPGDREQLLDDARAQ